MVINSEDYKDDPPVKFGDSIETRCITHPEAIGNYFNHLKKEHWGPPVEEES